LVDNLQLRVTRDFFCF